MNIAIIGGAGGMGSVTTGDAATSDGVERVLLVDRDADAARTSSRRTPRERRGAGAGRGHEGLAPRSTAPTRSSTPPRTGSTCP